MKTGYHHKIWNVKLALMLVLFIQQSYGQRTGAPVKLEHYALDSFTTGTVRLKYGTTTQQSLNYNLVTKEMIFKQGNGFLAIAQPETVDTIWIGKRKFVWSGKEGFYEWLGGHKYPV